MKNTVWLIVVWLFTVGGACAAQAESMVLSDIHGAVPIVVDDQDAEVVTRAATMLSDDIALLGPGEPTVMHSMPAQVPQVIVAGTLGQSRYIDELVSKQRIQSAGLEGQWERYSLSVIDNPEPGIKRALVIAGSDRRGTAYGLLSLSRALGISPWQWWADATPKKQEKVTLTIKSGLSRSPGVKYRGIFLNDEDWGLQRWAASTYEPETGDIGPKTYARIFELMLRLRANTLWPAMHKTTTPFYQVPGNKQTADDYAIVIGTSHAEPMLSNINGEWDKDSMGPYQYDVNSAGVRQFFARRISETADFESIYTVGMRGEHDSPMITGEHSIAGQVKLLDRVINDQRELLEQHTGKPASSVAQTFVPYKEVLTYYQSGLSVPNDVTLVWTDDNYGYLRQLSTPQEQKRNGGAGIYYHTSYWGRPHDYLWLNSTSPVLMWEEVMKAWHTQARQIWVLNVGDIKPHEYNTELFMDIAWHSEKLAEPGAVYTQIAKYLRRDIGDQLGGQALALLKEYYHLAFVRRPEFMAWSQVEPVTLPGEIAMTQTHYGDEVSRLIGRWETLARSTEKLQKQVSQSNQDAFYQLVYYPMMAAASHSLKWLYYYKNKFSAAQGRGDSDYYANKMQQHFDLVQEHTAYFNNTLKQGKWQHIMSASPRELPVFDVPASAHAPPQEDGIGLVLEASQVPLNSRITNSHGDVLPVFNAFTRKPRFVDLYLNGEASNRWTLEASKPWINLSVSKGTLTAEEPHQRVWVSIDWAKLPKGTAEKEPPLGHDHQLIPPSFKVSGSVIFSSADRAGTIGVNVFNPPFPALDDFKGYVEDLGYVSIDAEHYQRSRPGIESRWQTILGVGHSNAVVRSVPVTAPSNSELDALKNTARLEYDFYTFNQGETEVTLTAVPTHPLYKGRGVRVAVSVDDDAPQILDFATTGRSDRWKQNVLSNQAAAAYQTQLREPGKHTLKIWMIDAGVMLDEILIDLGGRKPSYLMPPATYNQAIVTD